MIGVSMDSGVQLEEMRRPGAESLEPGHNRLRFSGAQSGWLSSQPSCDGASDCCMGRVPMIVVVLTSKLSRVHHVQHLGATCAQKLPYQDRCEDQE